MFQLTHQLILGSKSPRRQELIKGLGFAYEIRTLDTDENYSQSLKPHQIASFLAELKAKALIGTLKQNELLLTSDTVVITFLPLESWEIDYYVNKYVPLDKAGSYGIQEWIGYIGIQKMNGSYYNVMGLPTAELWQVMKTLGYIKYVK